MHLFEVPFYYIEYGFIQLGALGAWENFIANTEQEVASYKEALAVGHYASIPEVYETAGV